MGINAEFHVVQKPKRALPQDELANLVSDLNRSLDEMFGHPSPGYFSVEHVSAAGITVGGLHRWCPLDNPDGRWQLLSRVARFLLWKFSDDRFWEVLYGNDTYDPDYLPPLSGDVLTPGVVDDADARYFARVSGAPAV